ncbi:MAG: TrbI/VirB10 family protein [Bacteriovoracia bacterium]
MKFWSLLVCIEISLNTPAMAMSDFQYQHALRKLDNSQRSTDAILRELGASQAETSPGEAGQSPKHKLSPLFRVHLSELPVRLQVGKLLYGTILNRLVIGADGSPVIIILKDDQSFASDLRLIGLAKQAGTQGRVSIEIQKIVFQTGKAFPLQGVALDADGAFGLAAQVVSGKALALAGSMAASFISGIAAGSQTTTASPFGFSQTQPTGRNAVLQGVAQTAADQSKRMIEEATQEKPILIVEAGTNVSVMVQEEVRF